MTVCKLNENWDLSLDAYGQIAFTQGDDEIKQRVKNHILLQIGESLISTVQGIDWDSGIKNRSDVSRALEATAMTVEHVTGAVASLSFDKETRKVKASLYLTIDESYEITLEMTSRDDVEPTPDSDYPIPRVPTEPKVALVDPLVFEDKSIFPIFRKV